MTVAKMLLEKLPGLKEVVIRLIMNQKTACGVILKWNVETWAEGLKVVA